MEVVKDVLQVDDIQLVLGDSLQKGLKLEVISEQTI
jgi:hypothetical protein